jgi:molybdate transport system permease protein
VGFLLLRLFAVNGLLGGLLQDLGVEVLFTWRAVVIAYSVMALPLMVRTMRIAFEDVHPKYEQVARTLGYGPFRVFFDVTLPASWKGVLAGVILGFTRAVGEFGASMTIGGNIAGHTRTLASSIYTAEQSGQREHAYALIIVAVIIGLATVVATEYLSSRAAGARNTRGR